MMIALFAEQTALSLAAKSDQPALLNQKQDLPVVGGYVIDHKIFEHAPPVQKLMSSAGVDDLYANCMKYNESEWKNTPGLRFHLAPDLERSGRLFKMSKVEIKDLLGDPAFQRHNDKSDREFYSLPIRACGAVARRYLELGYNSYGQLYWSRITVIGPDVYEFTSAHVLEQAPSGAWKIITADAPPENLWQIRIEKNRE